MYYFKYDDKSIEKYNVTFDKAKLMSLRKELIDNYSEVIHREVDMIVEPISSDYLKIRNYHRGSLVGTTNDGLPIYHYSYDEYNYPYIVLLINRLLKKDEHVLNEILNENLPKENSKLEKNMELYYKKLISAINLELLDKIDLIADSKKTKKKYKDKFY